MIYSGLLKMSEKYQLNDNEATKIRMLFQEGNFEKQWIVQEVCHARSIVVRCGDQNSTGYLCIRSLDFQGAASCSVYRF
jgi:hypothetical protein